MGRGSGGTKGGPSGSSKPWVTLVPQKGMSFVGASSKWKNAKELSSIKDKAVYKEVMDGIAKFNAIFGMSNDQKNIMLGRLDQWTAGTAYSYTNGKFKGILLNQTVFNKPLAEVVKTRQYAYSMGFSVRTSHPAQHTVVHELGHSLWNGKWTTSTDKVKMQNLFNDFRKAYPTTADRKKAGWGDYAASKVNEFFAEGIAKHILGKPDKYTKAIMEVAKAQDKNLKKK